MLNVYRCPFIHSVTPPPFARFVVIAVSMSTFQGRYLYRCFFFSWFLHVFTHFFPFLVALDSSHAQTLRPASSTSLVAQLAAERAGLGAAGGFSTFVRCQGGEVEAGHPDAWQKLSFEDSGCNLRGFKTDSKNNHSRDSSDDFKCQTHPNLLFGRFLAPNRLSPPLLLPGSSGRQRQSSWSTVGGSFCGFAQPVRERHESQQSIRLLRLKALNILKSVSVGKVFAKIIVPSFPGHNLGSWELAVWQEEGQKNNSQGLRIQNYSEDPAPGPV